MGNATQIFPSQFLLLYWKSGCICASYLQNECWRPPIIIRKCRESSVWMLQIITNKLPACYQVWHKHNLNRGFSAEQSQKYNQCNFWCLELHFLLRALTLYQHSFYSYWSTCIYQTCLYLPPPAPSHLVEILTQSWQTTLPISQSSTIKNNWPTRWQTWWK